MAGFVWKRVHTIAAAGTALVLVGVGTAVAIGANDDTGDDGPAGADAECRRRLATPAPTAAPASRRPDPVDPMTGRKPSDNPVVAVKVENIAAARPQVGLNSADIVFVEEVEGSLTRLVAVYHTSFPKRVGPVRSARNTDVELLPAVRRARVWSTRGPTARSSATSTGPRSCRCSDRTGTARGSRPTTCS